MVKLWNVNNGECVRTLYGHDDSVNSLELVSGDLLASGSADDTVKLWRVSSGECVRTLVGHTSWVGHLEMIAGSGSGKLASVSWDKTIRVWDVESGECMRTIEASVPIGYRKIAFRLLSN